MLSHRDFSETLAEVLEIKEFPSSAGYLPAAQRNDIVLGTVFESLVGGSWQTALTREQTRICNHREIN